MRLTDAFDLPYDRLCMHEVVFSGRRQKRRHGVTTLDMAKASSTTASTRRPLLPADRRGGADDRADRDGEPETLDRFVDVMHAIAEQAAMDPASLKAAPVTTPVGRLDEAGAARHPDLAYRYPAQPEA